MLSKPSFALALGRTAERLKSAVVRRRPAQAVSESDWKHVEQWFVGATHAMALVGSDGRVLRVNHHFTR